MKKKFLFLMTLLAVSLLALAEMTIYVYKKDGTKVPYVASAVDSIGFVDVTPPEAVDLGLPSGTKWANMNVGANSPEEYGDYFAWGETEPKAVYDWETYKWCEGNSDTQTKYCTVDNKTTLELSDDAAYVNWGNSWRMPTKAEQDELRNTNFTTWTWTTQSGVKGYKVTSKTNGNSIFLPAAGYRRDSDLNSAGYYGHYWSSSLNTSRYNSRLAFGLYFNSLNVDSDLGDGRCTGRSVRPVLADVHTITFNANGGEGIMDVFYVKDGESVTLPANTFTNGLSTFVGWNTAANGSGTAYAANGTVKPTANITLYAQWENATTGVENGYEWVDLGLPSGTKWATMNVGANSPEEYGDYFAWGETESKSIYNWETYKWCDGNHNSLTKYCANSDYGVVDNKNVLEFEDDVASVAFGGEWRIPTIAECEQLLDENNCLWTWTTQNNVKGFHVTSKINGNTIFLPAAGFCSSEVNGIGNFGAYCVNSIAYAGQVQISSNCYYLRFHSNAKGLDNQGRCVGICIRPVLSAK